MASYEPDERMKAVDRQEQLIIDSLGEAGALDATTQALSYDQKESLYPWIIRVYDLQESTEDN